MRDISHVPHAIFNFSSFSFSLSPSLVFEFFLLSVFCFFLFAVRLFNSIETVQLSRSWCVTMKSFSSEKEREREGRKEAFAVRFDDTHENQTWALWQCDVYKIYTGGSSVLKLNVISCRVWALCHFECERISLFTSIYINARTHAPHIQYATQLNYRRKREQSIWSVVEEEEDVKNCPIRMISISANSISSLYSLDSVNR